MKLRSRASGRYARALHDLALAESMLEPVAADMVSLQAILAESAEVRGFISDYQIPTGQRSGILEALFSNRLHPLVWQFVRFLESRRRLGLLAEVAADFREQEEARQGLVRGQLESAFAVTREDSGVIAATVGARLGKRLLLETEERPELLGGCRLQVGDTVYDFSLAAQLRMIRQTMMAG